MRLCSRLLPGLIALAVTGSALVAGPAVATEHGHGSGHGDDSARAAVRLYGTDIKPLATLDGVEIKGSSYGSSLTPKPGSKDVFYGLTDRGPNVDGPDGVKVEPLPDFQPAIGVFRLGGDGKARLVRRIGLAAADGVPYNGQANPDNDTAEKIVDLSGNLLPTSREGYDPEGLVALRDGTFWVSDEYGPFITHFDRRGRAIGRLSPTDGSLPRELVNREPNKGMEGLTVTPDGRTLIGVMQAAVNAPDATAKSKSIPLVRIVTVDLRTRAVHEYVYLLHTGADGLDTAISEISALNGHELLVDERDGGFEPGADKKLYRIDLRRATDIGPKQRVRGASYEGAKGGLLVGGRSLEALVGTSDTAEAAAALDAAGVRPVASATFLDVAGLVTAIDPKGGFFGHDKVEGVAVLDGGRRLVISNDSDFGIDHVNEAAAPFTVGAKLLPDGSQDDGAFLEVDMTKVPRAFR